MDVTFLMIMLNESDKSYEKVSVITSDIVFAKMIDG